MRKRTLALIAFTFTITACSDESTGPRRAMQTPKASVVAAMLQSPPDTIRNWYIVNLKPHRFRNIDVADSLVSTYGGYVTHVYERVLAGYAVANVDAQQLGQLRRDPRVSFVEDVSKPVKSLTDQALSPSGSHWGLDRVDQRSSVLNQTYSYFFSGSGVHVYIVDSGIRGNHVQFSGRIGNGVSKIFWSLGADPYIDQWGHGTAVAGVAAGSTHGIAKGAILHSVRVNESGSTFVPDLTAGLDWIAQNGIRPGVVNVSIESNSSSVSGAFDNLVSHGFQVFKAAGNSNVNACQVAENVNAFVVVVSGSAFPDQRASFANFGSCVDVFAPALNIRSAARGSATGDTTVSGTSFAAPFAAGVAALVLQQDQYATPLLVKSIIETSSTFFSPANIGSGSPTRLLNSHHRYLEITGLGTLESQTYPINVNWYAYHLGGNGSWTYQWEVSVNGGSFQVVGTGASYLRTILAGEQSNLVLRLTGTTLGESLVVTKSVVITPAQDCGGLPSC